MEIKDLAGFSEPMTKLIDVVAQVIGGWVKPWQIKRIANAKAYEIETVARALRKNSDALNLLEYDGEKVKMLCEQSGVAPEAAQELIALNERAVSRLTHRELRRQANIEKAVHYAMDELFQEENVSAEPVDEDWVARFFNIVEDVSNEQMQQLWGRILAGEIKRPKSYSLRTLETLKNISAKEAEVFCNVATYSFSTKTSVFIIGDRASLREKFSIMDSEITLLRESGLLSAEEGMSIGIELALPVYIDNDKYKNIQVDVIWFTTAGAELSRFIEKKANQSQLVDFFETKRKKEAEDSLGRIKKLLDNTKIDWDIDLVIKPKIKNIESDIDMLRSKIESINDRLMWL